MDRTQKQQLVENLRQDLADTVCMVVTHQTGLNVAEVTQLRRQVRNAGASYRVTKNRLARRALAGTPFELLTPLSSGPTAISFSRDPLAGNDVAAASDNVTVMLFALNESPTLEKIKAFCPPGFTNKMATSLTHV